MGIFDFFKSKKQEKDIIKRINFKEIEREIQGKKLEIENTQKEPRNQIKEELSELLSGLEQGQVLLEKLSLEEKKAPERAKLIVKENLIKFIDYLSNLISRLKKLEYGALGLLIKEINLIFHEFEEKSSKSFQKSTFLIGKELGEIRERITKFYRVFNKIVKENEKILKEKEIILIIDGKMKKFNEIEKNRIENLEEIKKIEETVGKFEKEIEYFEKEIENRKKSPEHIEHMQGILELEKLKTDLVIKLHELKELTDFKALTKVYHSIDNKMKLIKEYRENFNETFEKYGGEKLQELVNINEINQEKIKEIGKIKQNIESIKIKEDTTKEILRDIGDINRKIGNFNLEKLEKQRREKRLGGEMGELKGEIVTEFIKINILLEN